MVKPIYNTIQSLSDVVLKSDSGRLLVLPTAAGAVFNPGIGMQEIMATSRTGEKVIVDRYAIERKPEINLDYQQKSIQLIGARLGQQWEEVTNLVGNVFNSGILITQGTYAAAATGVEGKGMVADQAGSTAWMLKANGVSEMLTRQPFASFDPEVPKSFAQGADNAQKWSDDVVGNYVAFDFPCTIAQALRLSDTPDINYSMRLMTIMTDRSLIQWDFPSVSIKLDSGDINLGEAQMQLTFQVQDDGSKCLPYEVIYKGQVQKRRCLAD